MRALKELDLATFCALAEPFAAGCQAEADARFSVEQPRQRRAGGGRKGLLVSPEQKLLFLLFYLKTYPTFDVLGATFGLSRSKACERAHPWPRPWNAPCVRRACCRPAPLRRWPRCNRSSPRYPCCCSMPPNAPSTGRGPSWTGPPITRVKKRMTRKNTLIADPARYIHYLGPTTCGSTHDYQLLKTEFDANLSLLDLFELLADLGYLGLVADYDLPPESLPHRKPRRSKKRPDTARTDIQRTDNAAHARRRVKVEHAISGAKRLGCVTQVYRNKSLTFNDRVMALACGIWNWHLTKKKCLFRNKSTK